VTVVQRGDKRGKGARSPGMMYGALSGALLALIAALTVTASRTGPPTIAELSPSAVQQITDAPDEQSSDVGSGEGGLGDRTANSTTTTTPGLPSGVTTTTEPPVERARVNRCVVSPGAPPRQTEDPQSPPCVAFWDGDNGGATYPGVTADTITVAVPTEDARALKGLQTYFNSRFEFYGRQLKLVMASAQQTSTCAERKSGAVQDAEQQKAFAGLAANDGNAGLCYNSEIARRKLISVAFGQQYSDESMQEHRPYLWQYSMGFDKSFAAIAEMLCARLGTKPADHTNDPLLRGNPRKYGAILQNVIRDTEISMEPLIAGLRKCGANPDPAHFIRLSTNDDAGFYQPDAVQQAIVKLKQAGVTTVVNLGIVFVEQYIPAAADNQQYFPEWIFSTYGGNDLNLAVHAFWPQPSQRQSIMGIGINGPMRPYENDPAWWAFKEVDPTIDYNAHLGTVNQFNIQYRALMVLASGIQMAGPNLNPTAFERALQRTTFPYPPNDPTRSGNVGFKGDHSMTDDAVEFWWSDAARSPIGVGSDGSAGALCYTNGAARIVPGFGAWPTSPDPFFQGACNTGPTG
jgi:hypothetical protein